MCQHAGQAGARYCERCGHDLASPGSYVRWLTSADERDALDLGAVAGVTDPGAVRERNEDALAVGALSGVGAGSALTAVVCDGVSTSRSAELAARAATAAGIEAILSSLSAGTPPREATQAGGLAAAKAAAGQGDAVLRNPPACTYVSAVVTRGSVVVGWVGDSPAYWLSPGMPPLRLTVDDTAAGRLEAAGVPHDDERYGYPQAYALDRWLGADSPGLPIRTHTITPDRAGIVLVCSDGLMELGDESADLEEVLAGLGSEDDAATVVHRLVGRVRDRLTDDATVVVLRRQALARVAAAAGA